jgi:uroporphyrin-III C-methyltransferase/precorrin-2 dehydrogenase/sirohydrochlorin ferrochelatase
MHALPIFMRLSGRSVLVVGTGQAARAKQRLLDAAGARVVIEAALPATPLQSFALVFGATGDDAVDRAVCAAARAVGVPVNVVDRPELSDFIMPAVVDRGEVVVGISTNGSSPILAQRIRARIEEALPAGIERLVAFARRFRAAVQGRVTESGDRRRFWERFFDGEGAALVMAGAETKAARLMIRQLNGTLAEAPAERIEITLVSDDPQDLTLRQLRALRSADVIAHDAAVPAAILEHARRDARRIGLDEVAAGEGARTVVLRAAAQQKIISGGAR